MILIRLCHVADMPPPGELVRKLTESASQSSNAAMPGGNGGGTRAVANGAPITAASPAPRALSFTDVVALAESKRDVKLYAHLRHSVHLVRFAPPVIELRLENDAPRDLAARLATLLETETNRRWTIAISHAPGEPTLDESETASKQEAQQKAADHPLVQAIMSAFPGAKIEPQRAEVVDTTNEPPPDWTEFSPPDEAYFEDDGGPEL
jgi:DNA polymerase-3 subunit gamma/tau